MNKRVIAITIPVLALLGFGAQAAAPLDRVDQAVTTFAEGCKKDLKTYCKDVTPGNGRLLACILAYEDKISARCDNALYDASVELGKVVSDLVVVAGKCETEIDTLCANAEAGEGRIARCLMSNKDKLSQACAAALKGLDVQGGKGGSASPAKK